MKYQEQKQLFVESLLEKFPLVDNDEIDAMVTHWFQCQESGVPFLTDAMNDHCVNLFSQLPPKVTAAEQIREFDAPYQASLTTSWGSIPFPPVDNPSFSFIDLFSGIGGFRIAMQGIGGKCVFSSEWDSHAKKTYEANFGEVPYGDIRKIPEESIPDHDVLCAGFPCQPFSLAGVSSRNSLNILHGFACETQGTLFFDIARIIKVKKPKIVFLENVRNLVRHDGGKTFAVVKNTIESLGYSFSFQVIDSSPLVPQKRVRCYMVCIRGGGDFTFPQVQGDPLPLKGILEDVVDDSFTISTKLWEGHQRRTERNIARGTGFTAHCADIEKPSNTIVARYGKDGKECLIPQANRNPRMLSPRECARLQGFPESFIIPVAKTAAYRQFGNSVALPVIKKIAETLIPYI